MTSECDRDEDFRKTVFTWGGILSVFAVAASFVWCDSVATLHDTALEDRSLGQPIGDHMLSSGHFGHTENLANLDLD